MGIPVYIGGEKVGEASSPSDLIEIARNMKIKRFIAYAEVDGRDIPLSPSNFEEVIKKANRIIIIRKEIAGADLEQQLEQLERQKEQLLEQLESTIEKIVIAKMLMKLSEEQSKEQEAEEQEEEQEEQQEQEEVVWEA